MSADISGRGVARVLVDLSHCADGYVGIAQDTRLIFDMLAGLDTVDACGLLMPTGRHDLPRVGPRSAEDPAAMAGVLHWMARNWATRAYPRRSIGRAVEMRNMARSDYRLAQLRPSERTGALWRILFEKTLPPAHRERVLARDFYATDLSVMRIIDRAQWLPRLAPKRLATAGFDYALFCMPRPVRLASGTRQVIRFHDAVPVTDTDTVESWRVGDIHQRLVRQCAPDAVFVCNSPQSRESLAALDPRRAELAEVVPCALAPTPAGAPLIPAASIVEGRRVWRALPGGAEPAEMPAFGPASRYVLAVSTMEPRKNYPGLIRAWDRVINRSDPDLKLVVVSNPGWLEEPVLRAMAPHVRAGRVVHLAGLPSDELVSLVRQAACFAFPSFNEGFGYPPLEALQSGAPCVVSDIPVFRWIFGEAAVFVDPYDPESIAQGIERVAVRPGREALQAELAARAPAVLARFRPEAVAGQWAALLERRPEARR